jgi:hypothetical protein
MRTRRLILGAVLAACALATPPASAETIVSKTTWRGAEALQISNGTVELVVTTGLGPRVIRYAFVGGDNILAELPGGGAGTATPWGTWLPRGGHRLWVAPEAMPGSYAPDNGPVRVERNGDTIRFIQPADASGVEKEIAVTLAAAGTDVRLQHRLTNRGPFAIDAAAWALTIMRGGGMVVIPNEPYASHDDALQPVRAMTAWAYTDMSDPRWTFGPRCIRLRTDAARAGSQKIGVANRQGWAGYVREGLFFVKRYDWKEGARYPDFGVNTETYTAADFIELETLGTLQLLQPGASTEHEERWTLSKVQLPDGHVPDDALEQALGVKR